MTKRCRMNGSHLLLQGLLFSIIVSLIISMAATSACSGTAVANNRQTAASIGEYFDGEEFHYNIGFWWFKQAAVGKIAINKQASGAYRITLAAETMGFIGFITKYRKDTYDALIEEIDNGKRFRLKRFEKTVTIGDRVRRGVTDVDYKTMTVTWKSWGGGKPDKGATEQIAGGTIYDDPFTGFYNFRYGVYGRIEQGKEYRVPTFPKNGISSIYLRIVTEGEKKSRISSDESETAYLADAVIDKELFGSQAGNIEIHFTKDMMPAYVVAKDLILFGDVRGTLAYKIPGRGMKNRL